MTTSQRHAAAISLCVVLTGLFMVGRGNLGPMVQWNRAFADAAFVILCLILAIGPLARFFRRWSLLLPLRRELGIWLAAAAVMHVLIYASEAYDWNVLDFWLIQGRSGLLLLRSAFGAVNWVGLAALLYVLALALTANDLSQRALGQGWKLLQQQSYTLFALASLHAGLFLYVINGYDHSLMRPAFWATGLLAVGLQLGGYARGVARWRQRAARRFEAEEETRTS
jgi:DMSO/TMAO reductase YedYZ heme-binding membrane subunit